MPPPRRPADRSAPVRSIPKSNYQAPLIHEVVWSFAGDIDPDILITAGASPAWVPYWPSMDGRGLQIIEVGAAWQTREAGKSVAVTLWDTTDNDIANVSLDDTTGLQTHIKFSAFPDTAFYGLAPRFYVTAFSEDTGLLGHGLSFMMWWRDAESGW